MQPSLRPIFAGLLASIEQQPLMLQRAAVKAAPRRFLPEAHQPSAFGGLSDERRAEIRADEHADQLVDERCERDARGE